MRNQLTWQNTATPDTANRIVCWDNTGDPAHIAVDALVINPTASEDGYVLAWNDTNQEYELVAQAGGGVTADNGLTLSAGNIQLGGALTENTTITGASGAYDLILGTNLDPLDLFFVAADNGFQLETAAGFARFFINAAGSGEWTVLSRADIVCNTANTSGSLLTRFLRTSTTNNDAAYMVEYQSRTSGGGAAAGFGMYFTYGLSNSTGAATIDNAGQVEYSWADPTDGANYSNYRKSLRINDVLTEVMSIVTGSVAPNVVFTLQGLLNLPDLPTSSAGLATGTLWSNAGILTVA